MFPSAKEQVVLVVEDDSSLRELYKSALSLAGYAVTAVEDGLDVLRMVDGSTAPDAVVLDMALPRLRGRDVINELRAHPRTSGIPIIVATGTDSRDLGLRMFDCILRKPFTQEALVDAVANCLHVSRNQASRA